MIFLRKKPDYNCTVGNHAFKEKKLTKFFTVVSENNELFKLFFPHLLLVHTFFSYLSLISKEIAVHVYTLHDPSRYNMY